MSVKPGHPVSVLLPLAYCGKNGKPVKEGNKQSYCSKLRQVLVSWAICIVLQWEDMSCRLQEQISSLSFQNERLWFFCSPSAFQLSPAEKCDTADWRPFYLSKSSNKDLHFPETTSTDTALQNFFTRNRQSDILTLDIFCWRVKILQSQTLLSESR